MMDYKKIITGIMISFSFFLIMLMPIKVEASTNGSYSVSAVAVKRFNRSGSYLTVKAGENFQKGDKKTGRNKIHFKISKKCKWIYKNQGVRFPGNKAARRANYKQIRQYVSQVKELPENGYYTLLVKVKKKKIIKVVFQCL